MELHRAAMTDDDPVDDGKPKTGTLAHRLGGEERLEDMFLDGLAHSNTVVTAFDSYEPPGADSEPLR